MAERKEAEARAAAKIKKEAKQEAVMARGTPFPAPYCANKTLDNKDTLHIVRNC